ncbi:hypothetical protein [Methylobacterium sp. 77]|uniref:hypothetical protein n=1 Tax=Methylobacterium sp. 77 TaxID=1101192 RepID=UPI0003A311D4|nr:hypothetical protein [Methylobacterium sp. 77]
MSFPAAPLAVASPSASDAEMLIEALTTRLLSGDSATAILEVWCGERLLAREPRLAAKRVAGPDRQASAAQTAHLKLMPGETIRYRHVSLSCGVHILSEAENWYVPARLTTEMNRLLDATDVPFGRVVHHLSPTRRNLRVERLWSDARTRGVPGPSDRIFAIQAILSDRSGRPICEVSETYTGAILARGEA